MNPEEYYALMKHNYESALRRVKELEANLAIAAEALEFYSKPQNRIVDVAGKKHFIREYGCGCCSHSHDVDSDGSIGTMNCELYDVAGWTAREALAKIRGEE